MGLDLHHKKVVTPDRGQSMVIDAYGEKARKFAAMSRKVENSYVDWDRMFAKRGLRYADHFARSRTSALNALGKPVTIYGFLPKNDTGADRDSKIMFEEGSFWADIVSWIGSRFLGKRRTFIDKFKMRRQVDTVINVEQVGYQRYGVVDAFYEEFPREDFVADLDRVRRILELTTPTARANFTANFIDNWDPQTSLVVVSW